MKFYALSLLVSLAACSSNKKTPTEIKISRPQLCEMSRDELSKNVQIKIGNLQEISANQSLEAKEQSYRSNIANYDSTQNLLQTRLEEALQACGTDSVAASYFKERINGIDYRKLDDFLRINFYRRYDGGKQNEIDFYRQQGIHKSDQVIRIDVLDVDTTHSIAEFSLKLTSLHKTKILPVKAFQQTTYLREDGMQAPLYLLTGIRVSDEFGNKYNQASEPNIFDRIVPDEPVKFEFKIKGFIKSAKFAVLMIQPFAFGNNNLITLKIPIFKNQKISIPIAVYNELGLRGLKSYSQWCSNKWSQQNSDFMPIPVHEEEVKDCSVGDMLINKFETNQGATRLTSDYFSLQNIHSRAEEKLKKIKLSSSEVKQKISSWTALAETSFQSLNLNQGK